MMQYLCKKKKNVSLYLKRYFDDRTKAQGWISISYRQGKQYKDYSMTFEFPEHYNYLPVLRLLLAGVHIIICHKRQAKKWRIVILKPAKI